MKIRYYKPDELAAIFGIDILSFHRKVKPIIISDFKKELSERNIKNPDIGIDENERIYLTNVEHTVIFDTELTVNDYKYDE